MSNLDPDKFEFIQTPPAACTTPAEDCGVRTTNYPTIKNGPVPADSGSNDSFPLAPMILALVAVPGYFSYTLGGGIWTTLFLAIFTTIPILMAFWTVASTMAPRKNTKARYAGRPVEHYLRFHSEVDRARYHGHNRIPMETFYEKYFDGEVDFIGDALECLEFRHDWANFRFTMGLYKQFLFRFLPALIFHTRAQDKSQTRDNYDRGNDFYGWFLGPSMIYTSGIVGDPHREETLEELQSNKLAVVCEKIGLQPGDTLLDIGCGWGSLAKYASLHYGAHVTGVTLAQNQTAWGNTALERAGASQSKILCLDYRDAPKVTGGYKKITCLEMSEHVGVRQFRTWLRYVYDMLDDDGVFYMQYSGLRRCWQYEDLVWGLFMNKYVFPGADASTPLAWAVDQLEAAGFEVKAVDTVGVHYSATIWRWYRNWLGNRDKVEAAYGKRWFRIWEYFLASSTITSRQGGATCFQITLVKNINSTHRVEGIETQSGVQGALQSARSRTARGEIPSVLASKA
ncbi:cyclopropane fatty acid synthase [Aspergillus taichungensis]|uniref:sphingolipid C(9)-methyltransferase n=1 Tax=Aspergillus taichungensis TaxID=482145 RepID=A0A2J5I4B6_9EURO|nr:cyclopropane fatty acid synthase [Aspergillus taichungensis]